MLPWPWKRPAPVEIKAEPRKTITADDILRSWERTQERGIDLFTKEEYAKMPDDVKRAIAARALDLYLREVDEFLSQP